MPIKLNANEWTKLTQHKFKTIVRLVFKLNDITVNAISIFYNLIKDTFETPQLILDALPWSIIYTSMWW